MFNIPKISSDNNSSTDFGCDNARVMELLSKNLYGDQDVFIRELISNSSDALEKIMLRRSSFESEGVEGLADYKDLKIEIMMDKENKVLVVSDNGIGMTREDLDKFLGTIASSGTYFAKESMKAEGKSNTDMIGQFGLGFYSTFLMSDKVVVVTKHSMDKPYIWVSEGKIGYSVEEYTPEAGYDNFVHGTKVFMYLKEGKEEFLDHTKIQSIIQKYSTCIKYPILLQVEEEIEEEVEQEDVKEIKEEETSPEAEKSKKPEEGEKAEEGEKTEEGDEKKVKKIKKIVQSMKVMNFNKNIWEYTSIKEIPREVLDEFYKSLSKSSETFAHAELFDFEGQTCMKLIMFIPERNRVSVFQEPSELATNISFYNSNVLVTDHASREIVPAWMDGLYIAVSSDDFSLTVARDAFVSQSGLKMLRRKLPSSISKFFAKIDRSSSPEVVKKFHEEYSRTLKMAVRDTTGNTQRDFASLLRYSTNKETERTVTFNSYLSRAPENIENIYYLSGLSMDEIKNSMYLDACVSSEVILMDDPRDEYMLQKFKEYQGKKLVNISVHGPFVESLVAKDEEVSENFKKFVEHVKEVLKDKVETVYVCSKPTNISSLVFSSKYGQSSAVEQLFKAQGADSGNIMYQMMMMAKKVFVIFSEDLYIQKLAKKFEDGELEELSELLHLLFDTIAFGCGFVNKNNCDYSKSVLRLMNKL